MTARVSMTHRIVINAPRKVVFDYITNLSNDPKWRTEVDRMDVQGPREVGTLVIEYSTLFLGRVKTVTPTFFTTLDEPSLMIVLTPENHSPWLESYRELKVLGDNRTEFIYRLSFEVPKSGLTGAVYAWFIKAVYQPRLPKYMKTLKDLIEVDQK